VISHSPAETFELAMQIAEGLAAGTVILLSGDLGAGKTVFAKGIAAGLGIDPADVSSPSFTLINTHEGRRTLHHIDLYRLDGADAGRLGIDEMMDDPGAITVIEWAERLSSAPAGAMVVKIDYVSENERLITITPEQG
jgi:tRNA threonylcarbamoyladenosine biosynthesis protein TsaE